MKTKRHIFKVKVSAERLFVNYSEETPSGARTLSMDSPEPPAPSLYAALKALEAEVVGICEFPKDYANNLRVTGVSFTDKKEVMGAVILATKKLKGTNSPLNINTPHLPAEPYDHKQQHTSSLLPESCVKKLEKLIEEVNAFIDGKRAQMELGEEANT